MDKPTIICITPVKNEVWILERFLKCASMWADHIIIADQASDDGSREIAHRFPKVTLVDNPSPIFNEPERQKILLEAARRIPGPRLLIALDADEFLTANFLTSPEWNSILQAPAGTVIRFQWPIILEDYSYWIYRYEFPLGFVDDGSEHEGKKIHSFRLPVPPRAKEIRLREIKVMHYAFVDPMRVKSRIRWYQCWELLNLPQKRLIELYRVNHNVFDIPKHEIKTMPKEWLDSYEQNGIDMTSVFREGFFRWDKEILQLFAEHGLSKFKRLSIWDVDWNELYKKINGNKPQMDIRDPRSILDRLVHKWLKRTQPYFSHFKPPLPRHLELYFRFVYRLLSFFGW